MAKISPKGITGIGCLGLLLFVGIVSAIGGISGRTPTPTPTSNDQLRSSLESTATPITSPQINVPTYEITYTLANKRYDGGVTYYILINSVNLSNDNFKNDIKAIIKKMVSDKGNKITIEFHDSRGSLDISYKQYGDMSLGRVKTQEEEKEQATHFIAAYDGELSTHIYTNTLMFFPATFTSDPKVGKYLETIEFNP